MKNKSVMQPGERLKWCSGCQTERPPEKFNKNRSRADGLQNRCKECSYAAHRKSYLKNKKKYAERQSRWHKNRNLKAAYGITIETFEAMQIEQNDRCVICREETDSFHVDHNHETGQIRALLCDTCNIGLKMFKEDLERLERAKSYLEAYNWVNNYLAEFNDKGTLSRPLAFELD